LVHPQRAAAAASIASGFVAYVDGLNVLSRSKNACVEDGENSFPEDDADRDMPEGDAEIAMPEDAESDCLSDMPEDDAEREEGADDEDVRENGRIFRV
jgi:hypothetical protein